MIGEVSWFSYAKGYGFIRGDDGNDIFVHISEAQKSGLPGLKPHQKIEFSLGTGPKGGTVAVGLKLIEDVENRSVA